MSKFALQRDKRRDAAPTHQIRTLQLNAPKSILESYDTEIARLCARDEAEHLMNQWGAQGIPYFFIISYDTQKSILLRSPEVAENSDLYFSFPQFRNDSMLEDAPAPITLSFTPPALSSYRVQFDQIQQELQKGNTYLLNLTRRTPIKTSSSLQNIYTQASAKYKVYLPGHFVVFSPETFVRITDGKIFTFPMKGTIRTDIPHAIETLRDSPKERAEHASIVDLLRNDLGQIADNVRVNRYRYFEKVSAGDHELWQVSSEIEGVLPRNFQNNLGSLIFRLLPAGSITGVPKKKAVEIIQRVEKYDRGFYTGICGYFDGQNLDSSVMIRFIEQTPKGLVYKSGGGIHHLSDVEQEYFELIHKIYVPVD